MTRFHGVQTTSICSQHPEIRQQKYLMLKKTRVFSEYIVHMHVNYRHIFTVGLSCYIFALGLFSYIFAVGFRSAH